MLTLQATTNPGAKSRISIIDAADVGISLAKVPAAMAIDVFLVTLETYPDPSVSLICHGCM